MNFFIGTSCISIDQQQFRYFLKNIGSFVRTNTSNINLLVVESLKIFNKTLQEEGIYAWYIFCIKQSQWV
jgi:hypothetical protein